MFKLTYQAFTLLGISMAYILMRFLLNKSRALYVTEFWEVSVCFRRSAIWGLQSPDWFRDVLDRSGFSGPGCDCISGGGYPTDAGAIDWLNEHVDGSPVISGSLWRQLF